ncbi:MAG: DUF4177 domain-containing protein [Cytophagaceae bacterium]
MKSIKILLLSVCLIVVFFLVSFKNQKFSEKEYATLVIFSQRSVVFLPDGKEKEYKIQTNNSADQNKVLNQLAKEGWEVKTTYINPNTLILVRDK